ncbi:Hypothetical predicted protein [Paramuricea clavata]|uniref:Uncharacterized protein n=1 Tax=Paramuricea clavata TaxID=317549 RepID=A0A7D9HD50_PARCT|nr:Hypothetical predicted protein [Paramuricea clavata]
MTRYDRYCENLFHLLKSYDRGFIDIYHEGYVFHNVCAYVSQGNDKGKCFMRVTHDRRIRESCMDLTYNCQDRAGNYEIQFCFPGFYGGLCGIFHEECYTAVKQLFREVSMCSIEQIAINIAQRCPGVIVCQDLIKRQVEYYKRGYNGVLLELDHRGKPVLQYYAGEIKEEIVVQLPCDTVLDDEPLSVLKTIASDYKFFYFYLRVGREQRIQLAGGRLWPTIIVDGVMRTIPSFYIYLIAVTKCDNGDRYITIGVVHWLFGIYAELDIDYRIYPDTFKAQRSSVVPIYLPAVTFNSTEFHIDYGNDDRVERSLTVNEARQFVSGIVDTLITYINENYQRDCFTSLVTDFETDHGIALSTRLVQILIYHQKLVRIVQDWVISNCGCTRNDQICHCGLYTRRDVIKCRQLYFQDAGLLVSDAVYFTTSR